MSARIELLEKLVNRSCLSTQRATHKHVITIGGKVYDKTEDDREKRHQQELDEAVAAAEAKAEREKRQALFKLRKLLNEERYQALMKQREHFEEVARRVAEQRDRLEAEKMAELTQKMEEEKEEALKQQWQEALRQQAEAVRLACEELTKQLNREHRLDKEMTVASELKRAREGFKRRLEQALEQNTKRCEQLAAEEAARVAQIHADEITRQEIRYGELKDKYTAEHSHRQRVERDFLELQTDYQRFMNYTDGRYNSDYMMLLRRHGMRLSEKRMSDVSEYQEKPLKEILLPLRK